VKAPLVLKLGGELLESPADRVRIARLARALTAERPLVIVHGGGRAVDVELARRQIAPRKVDGLRITDADTLDVVVAVLAGSSNTALVAACTAADVAAVGLTGADAGLGRAARVDAHRATSGALVDLGFVGDPVDADPALIELLLEHRYVPVIASIGLSVADDGAAVLLNVNADVMACRVAAALDQADLVIAGGTAGVLDGAGASIPQLDAAGISRLIADGTATAGMVAKLSACRAALDAGVASVRIVDGRRIGRAEDVRTAPGTTLVGGGQAA
jgi:acetylglutamate kinase